MTKTTDPVVPRKAPTVNFKKLEYVCLATRTVNKTKVSLYSFRNRENFALESISPTETIEKQFDDFKEAFRAYKNIGREENSN